MSDNCASAVDANPHEERIARSSSPSSLCQVCGGTMHTAYRPWISRCSGCGFWSSTLWDAELWESKASDLDETQRERGIEGVRESNARTILDTLEKIRPLAGVSLLDVGCGYGWFLEAAAERGVAAEGVEPEERIAVAARTRGQRVATGLFPDALTDGQRFDVITFNDVLEHIPDVEGALQACFEHLHPEGLLAIAIPSSDGLLYRVALALSSLGVHLPLDRLWQRNFHSPHVSYFNPSTLNRLVEKHGFKLVTHRRLETVRVDGMWSRIRMDRRTPWIASAVMYSILVAIAPLIKRAPSDIIFHVFRKGT